MVLHIASRNHTDSTSGQPVKDHEDQSTVQGFAERHVQSFSGPPNLVAAENLFDLLRAKLVPFDMKDILLVPVEPGNDHMASVA